MADPPTAPPMPHADSARLHGLDSLRALAILLVFAHHYQLFVSREPTFGWMSVLGWTGVDLFFVLSGYLIANPLLKGLTGGQTLSFGRFYARRLMRTLPCFYVVLAAYVLLPGQLGGREPPPLWRFLSFTQNIGLQPGTAFSHAWSLCVEEQFYLLLPLTLWALLRLRRWQTWAWLGIAGLTAAAVAWRSWLWQRHGLEAGNAVADYHPNLYYASLARMDEFLPGVALALLKNTRPQAWAALMRRGQVLLLAGLAACALMGFALLRGYYIEGYGYGHAMTAWGYSAVAWSFALLVAAALSPRCGLHRLRIPGAASLALWSYAIYLSHKAVGFVWLKPLHTLGIAPGSAAALVLVGGSCLLLGWALYRFVERPMLVLRDRLWPDHFAPGCPRAPGHATSPA